MTLSKRRTTTRRGETPASRATRMGAEDVQEEVDVRQGRQSVRNEFVFDALPTPPAEDGWHFVWLSTTNRQDSIRRRISMGYVLVRAEELDGIDEFTGLKLHSGEWEGLVGVNEMILAKIPDELYQDYMLHLHDEEPDNEEELIRQSIVNKMEESKALTGGQEPLLKFEGGDGMQSQGRALKRPTFT